MTRRLMQCAALVAWLAVAATTSQAEESVSESLRIQWEVDQPHSGLRAVCGRVFNDQPRTAVRVRLRAEGVDGRGSVVSQRETEVLGRVASGSGALYCITMSAGAATYRVTVISADWTEGSDSP